MSNIRTFKDLESGPNSAPLPNPWTQPNRARTYSNTPMMQSEQPQQRMMGGVQYMGLDGYPHTLPAEKMQQNPVGSCCLMCCPCCVDPCSEERKNEWISLCKSFMCVISVIQIIMFIAELAVGGVTSSSNNPMIGPPSWALDELGAKNAYLERHNGEVYRFVVPIVLHAGFIHIIFNIWAQLRFGLSLERQWGIKITMIIYFISGIAGNLFSSLVQPHSLSVGASAAIMGILGANLAEVLFNIGKYNDSQRKMTLGSLLFTVVMIMIMSTAPFIDWSAHLGGLIVGFFLGSFIFTYEGASRAPKFYPWASLAATVLYFVLGFALFYTVVKV